MVRDRTALLVEFHRKAVPGPAPGILLTPLDRGDRLDEYLGVVEKEINLGSDKMSQQGARVVRVVPTHIRTTIRSDGKEWHHDAPLKGHEPRRESAQ